ncbi:long-chain-fatty-acid--CoA ligase [Beijerinckia sp. L45]|uniref:long-chain-fatty-acid--CoA ligase n=1 Tax=Beijerinckia sp. L45 TaxID=1641855 RepID=UPI00131DF7B9|nr:long-chain-fatty-acid--CoA ligase [Beijerinckia sp. L45]
MLGLMQDWPLLIHRIIDHAAIQYGPQAVVSRSIEGPIHRTTYAAVRQRALAVAKRLDREGIRHGDRVATLAWNTWRHVEAWYGITGLGAVYHTVNPRLFPEQIVWIINHAEDRLMMVDLTFVPLLEKLAARLPTIERYIVLTDGSHMPATSLKNAVAYEDWLAEADDDFAWAEAEERTAAGLCYTSGTTGDPKGVLYSHRSNVLHAMQVCAKDSLAPGGVDSVLCVVPMFHANAWALAFALPMSGAKMVLPGGKLDGASVFDLIEAEGVTMSAGVPTVWLMLLDYMTSARLQPSTLKRVAVGGSACPRPMIERFERDFGIDVFHAWGMTETSPVGSVGTVKAHQRGLTGDALYDLKAKQGRAPFGVEMIITDDAGAHLPWDGKAFGRLKVRGPCIASAYYRDATDILDADGYFDTNDIATIDSDGTMHITDRSKDIIKSGGEWISSIEIENLALGHPGVAEAAVIGIAHEKWSERPLLIAVSKPGAGEDRADLLAFLDGKIATWWIPDDVQYVAEIPHTAAGKIDKRRLREMFSDYLLPKSAP